MRGIPVFASLALALTAPVVAQDTASEQDAVIAGAEAFFAALRSEDKTALAAVMLPEAVIFVHNRIDPDNPRVDVVPVADHLARWAKGTRKTDEKMTYEQVLVDGDMAQVWGPYVFAVDGAVSHCGINSLSLVRMADGSWKVGNTSFTMVAPDRCEALGAPELGE
jgi:ketosteroid isomerase-like protein